MESSIAEFLARWPACERLPTLNAADSRAHRDPQCKRQRTRRAAQRVLSHLLRKAISSTSIAQQKATAISKAAAARKSQQVVFTPISLLVGPFPALRAPRNAHFLDHRAKRGSRARADSEHFCNCSVNVRRQCVRRITCAASCCWRQRPPH